MALKTPRTRGWKRWLVGGVVAVVVLGVGAPLLYKQFVESDNPPALALPTPTAAPESVPSASLDGSWKVASGSQAGYRVNQKVAGQTATTVGRTNSVTGTATVSGGQLSAGTVVVDLAKLVTNEAERDEHVREGILETDQYPTAVFTLTKPVPLGTITSGPDAQIPATGELTIHGATKPATVILAVRQSGDTLGVQGSTKLAFADYGIEPPATIPATSQIEFLLQLTRA